MNRTDDQTSMEYYIDLVAQVFDAHVARKLVSLNHNITYVELERNMPELQDESPLVS